MARKSWQVSFESKDFRGDREDRDGMHHCARGEWCSGRVITFTDGQRVVTAALTPRPYCDLCQEHIARCASDLPGFWLRLQHAIGDPLQAEVQVHIPFGPQIILREDVDAHLRLSAVILAAGRPGAERCRS